MAALSGELADVGRHLARMQGDILVDVGRHLARVQKSHESEVAYLRDQVRKLEDQLRAGSTFEVGTVEESVQFEQTPIAKPRETVMRGRWADAGPDPPVGYMGKEGTNQTTVAYTVQSQKPTEPTQGSKESRPLSGSRQPSKESTQATGRQTSKERQPSKEGTQAMDAITAAFKAQQAKSELVATVPQPSKEMVQELDGPFNSDDQTCATGFPPVGTDCSIRTTSSSKESSGKNKPKSDHLNSILQVAQERRTLKMTTGRSTIELQGAEPLTPEDIVSRYVEPVIGFTIMVNAVLIGVAVSHAQNWIGWLFVDIVFCLIYGLEQCIKQYLFGCKKYWTSGQLGWNIFDNVVLFLSLVEVASDVVRLAQGTETGGGAFYVVARIIRAVRCVRILRLLRFDFLKELLVMLAGLVSGLRTLGWALVLLAFPIYMMAIILTTTIGTQQDSDDPNILLVTECFGTLYMSMFTVFRCTIGDCSFSNGTPLIMWIAEWYGFIWAIGYILLIMLVTFGIFNLIMATFVDNASAVSKRNEQARMHERLTDKKRQTDKAVQLVQIIWEYQHGEDKDHDIGDAEQSEVARELFDRVIADPDVQQILEDLDISEEDRMGLFDVLDADGGGTLELDELIGGIIRLRGEPRRSDVIHVGIVVRSIQDELKAVQKEASIQREQIITSLLDLIGIQREQR